MTNKLPNYLRTFRKRSGLSQTEVAFLLGCEYGTSISRYERNQRLPNLKTALTLELIYQTESKHLFEGIYHSQAYQLKKRAAMLEKHIRKRPRSAVQKYKLDYLKILRSLLEGNADP